MFRISSTVLFFSDEIPPVTAMDFGCSAAVLMVGFVVVGAAVVVAGAAGLAKENPVEAAAAGAAGIE